MNEKEVKTGIKEYREGQKKPIVQEVPGSLDQVEIIEPGDPKWFEIVDYNGEKAKHYPYTGAYISVKTGRIMGNQGGRQDFDGSAMVTIAQTKKREAILDALTMVAIERGFGAVPTATLVEIIKKRAEIAIDNEGRDGGEAAKLILALSDYTEEKSSSQGPAVRIDIYTEESKAIIKKLLDL